MTNSRIILVIVISLLIIYSIISIERVRYQKDNYINCIYTISQVNDAFYSHFAENHMESKSVCGKVTGYNIDDINKCKDLSVLKIMKTCKAKSVNINIYNKNYDISVEYILKNNHVCDIKVSKYNSINYPLFIDCSKNQHREKEGR